MSDSRKFEEGYVAATMSMLKTIQKAEQESNLSKLEANFGKDAGKFHQLFDTLAETSSNQLVILIKYYEELKKQVDLILPLVRTMKQGEQAKLDAVKIFSDYKKDSSGNPEDCKAVIDKVMAAYKEIGIAAKNLAASKIEDFATINHAQIILSQIQALQSFVQNTKAVKSGKTNVLQPTIDHLVKTRIDFANDLIGDISRTNQSASEQKQKLNFLIPGSETIRNELKGTLEPLVLIKTNLETKQKIVPPAPALSAPKPPAPSAPALNQAAQIHPAPLSSSHGAKNAESQQKAAEAAVAKVPYVRASKPIPSRQK